MNAGRPSTSAAASPTSSPACSAVRCSGAGGVCTSSDASCASSRCTRDGSGGSCTRYSAGSLRASSSPATASLAAIIRCSISRCDSVWADGSKLATWPSGVKLNSGSLDSIASPCRASPSAAATRRAAASPAGTSPAANIASTCGYE